MARRPGRPGLLRRWCSGRGSSGRRTEWRGGHLLLLLLLLSVPGWAGPALAAGQDHPGVVPGATVSPDDLIPPRLLRSPDVRVLVPADPLLQDRLRVVHWPGDEGRADRAVDVLSRDTFLPGLPPDVPSRAVVFLAPNREVFDALTGGRVPHWGAGVAIPARRHIVIPTFANPWTGGTLEDRTLRHEWAHLGLHDHLDGLRIPRWFDEGYAQWSAGQWQGTDMWRLRVALARGAAPPLDSLQLQWPRDRGSAELAYLLSASAVSYLNEMGGPRGMEVFLERWAHDRDFEGAFRQTFGLTTGTFERRWIEHVKRRYGWISLLSNSAVFWGFLAVALLVLMRIRRRRDREKLARLRADEPPEEPAYWGVKAPGGPGGGKRPGGPGGPGGGKRPGGGAGPDSGGAPPSGTPDRVPPLPDGAPPPEGTPPPEQPTGGTAANGDSPGGTAPAAGAPDDEAVKDRAPDARALDATAPDDVAPDGRAPDARD
ncbi:MAG: hypothetical protein EA352_00845 [Gemmatimonadales bacterium]|nr:MAG: hypothetical protein EA352_00845 [Gemmatimonadales bacterium]